jgi:hypothetical protein
LEKEIELLTAWSIVKKSTIINGFLKAGLLRVEEGSDPTSDEAILRLFNSDTEGDHFSGFSAQEEEDSDQ